MDGFEVKESGPGYLSLAIVKLKDNQELAREIEERFAPINGIDKLEIDPAEGGLTVFFNYRQITSLFSLLALKDAFAAVFPEMALGELTSLLSANLRAK